MNRAAASPNAQSVSSMRSSPPVQPVATKARLTRGARWLLASSILGTILVLASLIYAWALVPLAGERRARSALASADNDAKQRAAWSIAENGGSRRVMQQIRTMLRGGGESDAWVRESLVHCLGRSGNEGDADLIRDVLTRDRSGLVRAAAWLSLARIAPRNCAELIATNPPLPDDWDRLGLAQAQLTLNDARGAPDVLRLAASGDEDQRVVAGRSILRSLRPALDAAGRWPLTTPFEMGEVPPAEFVAALAARSAELDLTHVITDNARHEPLARRVRRNTTKLANARAHVARFLFR
ncbi:MAG: hypothetical protein CHACPFDD_00073 [Phycisphaerae bacterium]|nr:hypothetical protein [Phycisphaerae bacterium]